jgi:hypothetical protein
MNRIEKQDVVAKKKDGTLKAEYKDLPRYPKVMDKYENPFKDQYSSMIEATMKQVKKIIK